MSTALAPDPRPVSGDEFVRCSDGEWRWGLYGAAGALFVHTDESGVTRFFLHERVGVQLSDTWSVPGGARDRDEDGETAAMREAGEELGFVPAYELLDSDVAELGGWTYTTVVARVSTRFTSAPGDESGASGWFTDQQMERLPLHPGFAAFWDRYRPTFASHTPARAPRRGWRRLLGR